MSNYLLLTNPAQCPKCRAKQKHPLSGNCPNCGMRLFQRPIDFHKFEADGNSAEWWLFHSQNGWMHRSHIMLGERALPREIPELVTERNTKTAQQRIAEIRGETARKSRQLANDALCRPAGDAGGAQKELSK